MGNKRDAFEIEDDEHKRDQVGNTYLRKVHKKQVQNNWPKEKRKWHCCYSFLLNVGNHNRGLSNMYRIEISYDMSES
jgi:hypothetical protein